ncbi:acyl-CoA dehydrogenase [Hydrocarboniphaga effusa]|jgi:alkylation response protein AidB-like acyl-CoA dehydrogenase|uniref:acyl-CoA dehydrogenase n=1 Tax=Hydrocarboniphaga effusa TaxID=243629 RepID=UPI003137DDC0
MSEYTAPLRDLQFVVEELAGLDAVNKLPGYEEATPDLVQAVFEEAAKFAGGVLSPLNRAGDTNGARWKDTEVTTTPGWKNAYGQFVEGGWNALACPGEIGGQNLPRLVSAMVEEMWNGANMAFALCPMLTRGAIEAIELRGSEHLKETYLPKMVSGEWTGTMNLTEPQAGSDLAAVRTRAVPQGDGSYKIDGQKIFITYGEHDLTDNIIHLVLARTPTAPEGVKGISLFVVPKFMVNADGSLGERNDVRCVSIEHKMGIHGSPTAVLAFGQAGGAVGYLVGEENRGLEYMFIMMNAARYSVGIEGIGISERAYQRALAYARDRVQGAEAGVKGGGKAAIIRHPDVRRMLMLMKAQTEAMRALAAVVAAAMDTAQLAPDAAEKAKAQAFVDLMIPIVKGWSTENSIDIASLGVQIHGGMGFIEETGAAQHLRDARITAIYEGTTGIQAADLVGRKMARDNGHAAKTVIASMRETAESLKGEEFAALRETLSAGIDAFDRSVQYVVANYGPDVRSVLASSVPLLKLFGIVAGGWQLARSASIAAGHIAAGKGSDFYKTKLITARFYADHVLSQAPGLAHAVVNGAVGTLEISDQAF